MNAQTNYFRALRRSTASVALCALLVAIGYFVVDRPVAYWVHDRGISQHDVLRWITLAPPVIETWSPLVLALVMIRRAFGPVTRFEWAMFAAALGLMVADEFRESLSIVFGRDWPETWIDNNPSLIGSGAYGFNWFQGKNIDNSFPSGHMARTVAAAAVFWVAYPRKAVHATAIGLSLLMAVSLIGMNYHFVSDVIAGSFLGAIVGAYSAALCGLSPAARKG